MSDLEALLAHTSMNPGSSAVVAITVPWETRVKKRARVTGRGTYKEDDADEKATAAFLRIKWGARPVLVGPVSLTVVAYRKTKRRADIDNIAKHVMDAGNGIIWEDDSQVVTLVACKVLSDPDPRTVIVVGGQSC